MPRYSFNFWEEQKWGISFEADSLEHARQIMEFAEQEADVDLLPEIERFFKKGSETWDYETLTEED